MLQELKFAPTMNANNTQYSAQGSWRIGDKVRFANGSPETIGGWQRKTSAVFQGVCRALIVWRTLAGEVLTGVGTHLKYYIERGGGYYDITPLRSTVPLTNPFKVLYTTLSADISAVDTVIPLTSVMDLPSAGAIKIGSEEISYSGISGGSLTNCIRGINSTTPALATSGTGVGFNSALVTHTAHGAITNDFVTYSGSGSVGGISVLNAEFQIIAQTANTYWVYYAAYSTSGATGGGSVSANYQINTGPENFTYASGYGTGGYGSGGWGAGSGIGVGDIRLWNHQNFGEDLVYGPRGGGIYYLDASLGLGLRGVGLNTLAGASNTPTTQLSFIVTDTRFLMAFGVNPLGGTDIDPLLIRWSDQELIQDWTPTLTNLAGDLRLSIGTEIVAAIQLRKEVLVWTDAALYSLQYVDGVAYTQTLVSDNISIVGPNSVTVSNGIVYWMGRNKFYVYTGQVNTLDASVQGYVFDSFNRAQAYQVYCGPNEGFDEVWWFYPSADSQSNDRYVAYNFVDKGWIVGALRRSAWYGGGMSTYPIAADDGVLLYHEIGVDDASGDVVAPISAYIESADFALNSGDVFSLIQRILPDMDFSRSTSLQPTAIVSIKPRASSGGAYIDEVSTPQVVRTISVPVQVYTEQVWLRARGRQAKFRVESSQIGTAWRIGTPRVDIKEDGRRS